MVKKTEYNELVKKVNNSSTTDSSNLVKKTDYNTKISEIENKITAENYLLNVLLLKNLIN